MRYPLEISSFRTFDESDWMGFAGATEGEGGPLIYDGDVLGYTIIIDKQLVGCHLHDPDAAGLDCQGAQIQVRSFAHALRIIEYIRFPSVEDFGILECLGFELY